MAKLRVIARPPPPPPPKPVRFESWGNVRGNSPLRAAAKRAGFDNEKKLLERLKAAADAGAKWVRWAPGAPHGSANLQVHIDGAIAAAFAN